MASVPEELRPAVAEQLRQLVDGRLPQLLTWVRQYGRSGATLIPQPEEIWTHRWTEAERVEAGDWWVVVPLWTTDESPSDLSAEIVVRPDGQATIHDVHVL